MTYADVLTGRVVPGRRVAVVGAGGIGVDVSHFLTHDPADDLDDWMAHWGVGDPALHPGGLTEPQALDAPLREVTLVQRKTTPIGIGLGKTSGWAHRAVLKQAGVRQVARRVVRPGRRRRPAPDASTASRWCSRSTTSCCARARSPSAGCTTSWSPPASGPT